MNKGITITNKNIGKILNGAIRTLSKPIKRTIELCDKCKNTAQYLWSNRK